MIKSHVSQLRNNLKWSILHFEKRKRKKKNKEKVRKENLQ
jgi:hypothetical protein